MTTTVNKLRIGYTCNIRDKGKVEDERYNEWEPPESVEAVTTALVDAGCEVSIIDVGSDIFHVLEANPSSRPTRSRALTLPRPTFPRWPDAPASHMAG